MPNFIVILKNITYIYIVKKFTDTHEMESAHFKPLKMLVIQEKLCESSFIYIGYSRTYRKITASIKAD